MEVELFNITNDTYEPYNGDLFYNNSIKKDQIFIKSFFVFLAFLIVLILINGSY